MEKKVLNFKEIYRDAQIDLLNICEIFLNVLVLNVFFLNNFKLFHAILHVIFR
jgi:hypothetical protein